MCDALVFSKDRACQLDALLRSITEHGPDYESVTTLFDYSDAKQCASYAVLGRSCSLWPETDFYMQTMTWLERAGDTVAFLVDDQVFYRAAELAPLAGVVYQLGLNATHSHPMGCKQTPEGRMYVRESPSGRGSVMWRWRGSSGDFGYPLSIGGNVYDKAELLEILPGHFDSPTSLEAGMAARQAHYRRDTLTAPLHSCLVSLPHNRVTTQSSNPISGDPRWSADALCDAYLDGYRIDYAAMDFSAVDAAHCEIPLVLTREVMRSAGGKIPDDWPDPEPDNAVPQCGPSH